MVTASTVALVGADSLLIESGERLLDTGHQIVVVGAGSERVRAWARQRKLPTIDVTGPASAWKSELATYQFDWLMAVTHLRIIPVDVLALAAKGAINFHDGPLPAHRGLNTPAWALIRGDATWGVTWHLMTIDHDRGDIIAERTFDISPDETSLSLNTRNLAAALEAFEEFLPTLGSDVLPVRPQVGPGLTATRRNDRPEALGVLDWQVGSDQIDRLVRALDFGPYPNPLVAPKLWGPDGVVIVTAATVDHQPTDAPPGTVAAADADGITVGTADGAVCLTNFTTLSGQPLDAAAAASQVGADEGRHLPLLSSDQIAALAQVGGAIAAAEPGYVDMLSALEPIEVPWATAETASTSGESAPVRYETLELGTDAGDRTAAAFLLVLARLSGKSSFDVAAATPHANDPLLAHLIATERPLRVSIDMAASLDVALQVLAEQLDTARSAAPLGRDVIARYPHLAADPFLRQGRLLPTSLRLQPGVAQPSEGVVVELQRGDDGWQLVFDAERLARRDAATLAGAVHAVLAAPSDLTVSDVDLLGAELRQRVVVEWNDTFVPYDRTATIHSLFESQADRTPQTRAVVCNGRSLTYAELDARANQLVHHLVGLGVRPGDLVGVHLERSLGLVVTALAVMKAGAAYVPLDPSYPHDRLVHMVRDSGCAVLVTDSSATDAASMGSADRPITVVQIERDRDAIEQHPQTRPSADVTSEHVAYCIYTSGSTGLPKGVLVEHRNVVNFFTGMDPDVPHELPATWFAVTSLSFDISVLELFYTLTRGFTVVVYVDHDRVAAPGGGSPHAHRPIDFSLFYFSGDASSAPGPERYRLLIEGARYADQHGFRAVWTPERHFHAFGGLYPAPAVTGAAVAAVTENVQIRAGSVVLPLDHPIRVVEAWSVIDNISNGRVGISIASGWQPNDFVLRPENYATAKQAMFDGAETLRRLWRGETVAFDGPLGAPVDVATMPSPVQPELPLWVTTAGNPDTYVQAGRIGANVLTHLLGQSVEQLAPKIEMYRQARAEAGFDPDAGVVSLMLHTYVGHDDDDVRDAVRGPLKEYLGTSFSLLKEYAWSFPAFARPAGSEGDALADADFADLSPDDLDAVLEFAFLRYFESSGLFGTPERCLEMVDRLKAIGVDEIACLVDFGVDTDSVLASLPVLTDIMVAANPAPAEPTASTIEPVEHLSVAEQLDHYEVTHLQCTPSMARMFSLQDDTRGALAKVPNMYVGGEALPVALARDLSAARDGRPLTNMYGPTETTIWSTTWRVPADVERIQIGQPIANTAIYILDTRLQPVLPGVPGDLWIGGDGVVRGYHERPELTAERFVTDPFRGSPHRMYCTGDLARWVQRDDGTAELEFLGRLDHQVKVRGYRIELGEIEAQLGRFPGIRESVVVVREDEPGDQQLVGYLSCTHGSTIEPTAVREHLRVTLPDPMVPSHIVVLDDLPHTPNGKIDRNALPAPGVVKRRRSGEAPVAAASDLEREVLDVWHDVLGHTDIGVDENFFDVGGHSLLVVRMHRRLKERLDRPIALTDLYRFPTVRTFTESLTAEPDDRTVRAGVERAQRRRQRRARA